MEKIIDLHIHTNMSDGSLSPKEVIDLASKNRAEVIAIADHDTIDAYSEELFQYAHSKNIHLIPAVEISTKTKKCGIHVLGYNFDVKNQDLKNKLSKLRNARHDYLWNVSKKLTELGYIVNTKELNKIESVTKAHISNDIIHNEKNEKNLLQEFGHIPNKGEFIEAIMNEGCPAYVKKESITPKEAADLIRKAGGKVVLAHPVAYQYEDNLSEEDILALVNDMEINAIEANYLYVDRNNRRIDDCEKWRKFAKKNNFVSSIGSDFHTEDTIHPTIGFKNWHINFTHEDAEEILAYLSE